MPQGAQQVMESPVMTERDLTALRSAIAALEHPSLAARLGNMIGKPIELIGSALPAAAAQAIGVAPRQARDMLAAANRNRSSAQNRPPNRHARRVIVDPSPPAARVSGTGCPVSLRSTATLSRRRPAQTTDTLVVHRV